MAIRLRLDNYQSKIPIRVGGILPDAAGCQLEDLKRRATWLGNRQLELGELFELTEVDELRPWAIRTKERSHARRDVRRKVLG